MSAVADARAEVDAYVVTKVPAPLREIAAEARDLLRAGIPGATEAIKWNHPVWERDGFVAILRAAKAYVTVGFVLGPDYSDPHGLLEGTSATMRHVKLTALTDQERAALRDYTAAAVAANAAGR